MSPPTSQAPAAALLAPGNGGLSVARALVRRGHPVTVIVNAHDSYPARTRGAKGVVLPARSEPDVWLEALAQVGTCAALAGDDRASLLLAEGVSRLPAGARAFEALDDVHLALMNKASTYEIAERAGVRYPWSAFVTDLEGLQKATRDAPYPCIMKAAMSHEWRATFGEDRVVLAHTPDDLLPQGELALEAGIELVISEYVPGADDQVEEAIVVRAPDGSYPVAFGCRKIRQFPPGFGAASLCASAPVPKSMALAKRLLDEAGFVGVAGVETKHHAETGEVFLIEANVRIPTQFGLGDASGGDSAWRLYATLAGLPLGPQPELRWGAKLVIPELEMHAAFRVLREGHDRAPSLRERFRSWRGAGDLGLLDLRDPGPAIAVAARAIRRRLPPTS